MTLARPDVNDLKSQDFQIVLRALKCFHEIFPCKVNLIFPNLELLFRLKNLIILLC